MTDRFVGTTPNPVHVGGSLYPKYTNPDRAGETVTINIVDSGRGQVVPVEVILDQDGVGSIAWPVPLDWGPFATLEGPDSEDHVVLVTGSKVEPAAAPKPKKPPAKKPPARSAAKGKTKR